MEKSHWIVSLLLIWFCSGAKGAQPVQLLTSETHSRIVVPMIQRVPVEWKNSQQGFEIVFKGISFNDLGAPIGEEESWRKQIIHLSDARVESIKIQEIAGGVQVTGRWKFPTGAATLAHPEMVAFDYWQKEPFRYVVDFWLKEGPTKIAEREAKLRNQPREALAQFKKKMKERAVRKLASLKQPVELNSSQYCERPLSEENDLFLDFNPVHQKVDFSRWFPLTTADQNYSYLKPEKGNSKAETSKEDQYIRLALTLAEQGKSALAIRALDFMDEEFPRSKYRDEARFLRANSLIKLGFHDAGERALKELSAGAKDMEIALQASLYLSLKMIERDSILAALDQFLWLIQSYPRSKLLWVFHLGAAECLYSLKQTERALKEYEWVMENAPTVVEKSEAAFRMGDLFLLRRQHDQALASYSQALSYFKSEAKRFPTLYLNRGEAFYQLGHYEEARSVFESFLAEFPNHSKGWRASFRLGEIAARTQQTKKDIARSFQWYSDTINRYPASPGVVLSRVRLAPCGDHGGLNFETQDRFFLKEAREYDGGGEVLMDRYSDFLILSHARTVIALGSLSQALDGAIREITLVKSPQVKKVLISTTHQLLGKVIRDLLGKGKKYEALSYYTEKISRIPPSDEMGDVQYLLTLSEAASDLGLSKFSIELLKSHQRLTAGKKPESPEPDDLEAHLKGSEKYYAEVKALWIQVKASGEESSKAFAKADAKMRELLAEVSDESNYSYQKQLILGLLDEKQGNLYSAILHASRAQLMARSLRVDGWLASLQTKIGDSKSALKIYRSLEKKITSQAQEAEDNSVEDLLGLPPLPSLEEIAVAEGQILEKFGRWGEIAATYSRAIESGAKGDQIQYEYARALLRSEIRTEREKGKRTLEKLAISQPKNESDIFWKKLAGEALANTLEPIHKPIPKRGKRDMRRDEEARRDFSRLADEVAAHGSFAAAGTRFVDRFLEKENKKKFL